MINPRFLAEMMGNLQATSEIHLPKKKDNLEELSIRYAYTNGNRMTLLEAKFQTVKLHIIAYVEPC